MNLSIDGAHLVAPQRFTYKSNPTIADVYPRTTIHRSVPTALSHGSIPILLSYQKGRSCVDYIRSCGCGSTTGMHVGNFTILMVTDSSFK